MESTDIQTTRVVQTFESCEGGRIYQIPLEVFPGFWAFSYLVLVEDPKLGKFCVLIDAGSGYGKSNQHLEKGFKEASQLIGTQVDLADLSHIFITHGHIDHFGGLMYVRPKTSALLGVHELDRRVLINYEERLTLVSNRLDEFLIEAGISPHQRKLILDLYSITKGLVRSMPIDFTYEAIGMRLGPFEFKHVPGHCAGHVVIRLHDVLFSGDHVLEGISPHQAPERLTLSTGLDHYLNSLEVLRPWAKEVRLTLPGHKTHISDLQVRLNEIQDLHHSRLDQVLEILKEPGTIADISDRLFGEVQGYNILLALEEAGAHVEYLYQRGFLKIANLEQMKYGKGGVAIHYQKI
jgi:glyoxylase-like metal-dependent hydrolase (beta-lactamase superfamily II)